MDTLTQTLTCSIKTLPQEKWVGAAEEAAEINPANAPSLGALRRAAPDLVIEPQHLALLTRKYWGARGVHLTVGFLDNPKPELRKRILSHMNAWNQWANVNFVETATDPQVRIARSGGQAGGFWSYLGTDVLNIAPDEPTMNLEGFTMNTRDAEFTRIVRHETGHTLGFPHEHLRKEVIDRIDPDLAIPYFMDTQGWTSAEVISNVLTPLPKSSIITAAPQPDLHSIMCYLLPASIMKNGAEVDGGADISPQDSRFAARLYPK